MIEPELPSAETATGPDLVLAIDSLSTPTLTKAQLAEALFEQIGLSKREAKEMIEAFFDIIAEQLIAGNGDDGAAGAGDDDADDADEGAAAVKIAGFGNFRVRHKNPRPGRNPRTGELVPIAARRVITFHASPKLKARIQGEAAPHSD